MPYKYRESQRKAVAKYYQKNKEKLKERAQSRGKKLRRTVLEHYGNKCVCCNEKETKFLTIDHINGEGGKHLRSLGLNRGGVHFYYWIIKNNFPVDLQILCWNCNMAKAQYGECPHESRRKK